MTGGRGPFPDTVDSASPPLGPVPVSAPFRERAPASSPRLVKGPGTCAGSVSHPAAGPTRRNVRIHIRGPRRSQLDAAPGRSIHIDVDAAPGRRPGAMHPRRGRSSITVDVVAGVGRRATAGYPDGALRSRRSPPEHRHHPHHHRRRRPGQPHRHNRPGRRRPVPVGHVGRPAGRRTAARPRGRWIGTGEPDTTADVCLRTSRTSRAASAATWIGAGIPPPARRTASPTRCATSPRHGPNPRVTVRPATIDRHDSAVPPTTGVPAVTVDGSTVGLSAGIGTAAARRSHRARITHDAPTGHHPTVSQPPPSLR